MVVLNTTPGYKKATQEANKKPRHGDSLVVDGEENLQM
jgi:hypothetical protein